MLGGHNGRAKPDAKKTSGEQRQSETGEPTAPPSNSRVGDASLFPHKNIIGPRRGGSEKKVGAKVIGKGNGNAARGPERQT